MTLDEFLRWEDGTDTRYELIRGVPVAREVQPVAHGMLVPRLCSAIHSALKTRRDYAGQVTAAIASPSDANTCYLADLIVAPMPIRWNEQLARDPILIIEVLSASTATFDRENKVPDYRGIASGAKFYWSIPAVPSSRFIGGRELIGDTRSLRTRMSYSRCLRSVSKSQCPSFMRG